MSQWLLLDFTCPTHGKFEKLCDKREGIEFAYCPDHHIPDPVNRPHAGIECSRVSPRVECYAVHGHLKRGEVTQGRNSESERPANCLDTRDLGDGMSMTEWEAKNDIQDRDERHKQVKEMLT